MGAVGLLGCGVSLCWRGLRPLLAVAGSLDNGSMMRSMWVVVVAGLLFLMSGVVASSAQESEDGAVLLILDASGSMNLTDDNGDVLIDGAKSAVARLIGGLPEGSQVGLMVYGHRVPNDDQTNGCQDTELVVPVGPLDRQGLLDAVDGVEAKGFTPIGRSLEEAAAALPGGRGTVILVSDGEDTCAPPDPCEVAATLLEQGVDVRVHTVGFFLADDEAARRQLQCIAEATDGTYHEIDAVDALAAELGALIHDALPEGTEPMVIPLDGATTIESAPLLRFGAGWSPDALQSSVEGVIKPGETRWYAFDVADGPLGAAVSTSVENLVAGSVPGEFVRISITDGAGVEYQTGSSRFGRDEIELSTVDTPAEAHLGTTASFNGFDVLWADDPNIAESVTPLGLDQESYDAIVAEMLLRPAPRPLTSGRYYITIEWEAEPSDDERYLILNTALWPHSEVKHLVYTDVDGSTDAASRTKLHIPSSSEAWMAPLDGTITNRGGYLGPIRSSETTWYEVRITPGSSLGVRAFLNRPLGAADGGEFRVELHDTSGSDISQDYLDYPHALDLDDSAALHSEGDFGHPNGVAPRPLVGASTADADNPVVIAFVWDAPPGEDGQVEFVVDIVAGDEDLTDEAIEQAPTQEPTATTTEPAPVAEDPADDPAESGGLPVTASVAVLVVLIGGVAAYVLYRRRANHAHNR
jgi:hypothetical protein